MCFTGNFALSMMLEPAMLAPVLSQPSLPMFQAGGMHIAPDELAAVKARMEREDLTVLAYRFAGDPFCKRGALRRLRGGARRPLRRRACCRTRPRTAKARRPDEAAQRGDART